jgi:hypothetical protein
MNANLGYIDNIFKDIDGHPSSKRWVTFICLVALLIAFFADLFYGYKMDSIIYDGIKDITIAGLGFTGLEQFAKKTGTKQKDNNDNLNFLTENKDK